MELRGSASADEGPRMKKAKPTLLLVEDDAILRETLCHHLEIEGRFKIATAATGEEAIKRIASKDALDLLITDFDLRGRLDGLDVARAMRERDPQAPILLVTGSGTALPRVKELLQLSRTRLLTKPFQQSALDQAIGSFFDADHNAVTMNADDPL